MERLILFDIDGTLVEGGPAKGAFHTAMMATFGTAGPIGSHSFAGKTDPQTARELLAASDFDDAEIDAGLPRLWDGYVAELESRIVHDPNAWFADDPAGLAAHLKRLVHVSVETTRIVDGLPLALAE